MISKVQPENFYFGRAFGSEILKFKVGESSPAVKCTRIQVGPTKNCYHKECNSEFHYWLTNGVREDFVYK